MRLLEFRKRFFSATLATVVAVTTMYGNVATVVAAPSDTTLVSDEYTNVAAVDNAQVAQNALSAYQTALAENSQESIQAALEAIANLTPTQRIHLFLLVYKDYYNQAFLDANFPYFNVNAYIARYPEVLEKYAELSGNELYEAVLNDYIETGIFEGKSSCTDFDPIIALLAYPDETYEDIIAGMDDPGEGLLAIFDSYVDAEGSTTTSHYQLSSDLLGDRLLEVDDEEANFHNIFLTKEPDVAPQKVDIVPYHADQLVNVDHSDSNDYVDDNNGSHVSEDVIIPGSEEKPGDSEETQDGSEETPGGSEDNPGGPEEQPGGSDENPDNPEEQPSNPDEGIDPDEDQKGDGVAEYQPINNKANKQAVGVFELYSLDPESVNQDGKYPVNSTVIGSNHKDDVVDSTIEKTLTGGWFDVDAYKKIAGQTDSGKKAAAKTTILLYMYGTDLEEGEGTVTYSIGELLKKGYDKEYDTSELNIVIATGATQKYTSESMNNNSGDYKCCYYYLDPTKLSDDIKAILSKDMLEVSDAAKAITSENLIPLGQYGQADFGDSSMLAGLVDMTYDLFAADNYVLVFNDHGGGINGGIGSASKEAQEKNQTTLEMSEMEEALGSTRFYNECNKFAMIGYDACLMGGIEVAYNMSPYGDYMLACSESEAGSWDYGDLIDAFTSKEYLDSVASKDVDANNAAVRNAVVSLAKDNTEKHTKNNMGDVAQSFSVINLNELDGTVKALNDVGRAFNEIIRIVDNEGEVGLNPQLSTDVYYAMRSARARTYSNGSSNMNNLFEYVDVYDYMSHLSDAIQTVKTKWEAKGKVGATEEENCYTLEVEKLGNCIDSISELLSCSPIEYSGVGFANETVYDVDTIDKASSEGTRLTFEDIAQLMTDSSDEAKSTWLNMKGNLFCGTTIYMPYYSAEPSSITDTESSLLIDDSRYIEYEAQNLISEYTEFVKNYVTQKNSNEETERLNRLKKILVKSYSEGKGEDSVEHLYYEDLFGKETVSSFAINSVDPENPYKSQYVNIPINKAYAEERKNEIAGASIDTYTDFKDVLKEIKIYMIKSQEVAISDTETAIVDVVVGQAVVNGDAINGSNEAINIILERHKTYKINGKAKVALESAEPDFDDASEYLMSTTIDDMDIDLAAIFGKNANYVLFSGTAELASVDDVTTAETAEGQEQDKNNLIRVYNVYSVEGDTCTLEGVLQEKTTETETGKNITYDRIDDKNDIKIVSMQYDQYHQVRNEETGQYFLSKSDKATESSIRFVYDDDLKITCNSNNLSVYGYDKANVEIIFDIQATEDGSYYSHMITDIKLNKDNNIDDNIIPELSEPDVVRSQIVTDEKEATPAKESSEADENDNQPIAPVDAAPVEPTVPSEPPVQTTSGEGYSSSNGESGEGNSSSNGENGDGDSSANGENGDSESTPSLFAEGENSDGEATQVSSVENENSDGESTPESSVESESGDGEAAPGSSTEGESNTGEASGDSSSENSGASSDSSSSSESSSSSSSSSESSSSSSSSSESSSGSSSSSDSSSSSSSDDSGSSDGGGSSDDSGSSNSDDDE